MRIKYSEIEKMSLDEIKEKLAQNEEHLDKLYQLKNKDVAFYNREVYETEMNVYSLNMRLEELNK